MLAPPPGAGPTHRASLDGQAQRGFTLVELIAVLVLVGALAVAVGPKMDGALSFRTTAWRDQVLAALRQAGTTARGHRRLVCVSVATGSITLTQAAANPATNCSLAVAGPDGHTAWARDAGAPSTSVSPAGLLYFQPDGRVTTDGAGLVATNRSISLAGEADIGITAETGHVR